MQNGETEIAQNEAKLADSRKEYEDGKETSEEEIAKGEKKLADAKEQIKKKKKAQPSDEASQVSNENQNKEPE